MITDSIVAHDLFNNKYLNEIYTVFDDFTISKAPEMTEIESSRLFFERYESVRRIYESDQVKVKLFKDNLTKEFVNKKKKIINR